MATDPGWPDFATLVARTAETPVASTVHEPFGSPSGPGLFHVKGLQLPAYVQHVAHHLVAQGHPESKAIQMAIGIVKNWAAGHDGHGNKVHADVQAAAGKAVAEWEAAKAASHGGKRFNPYHLPAGTGGGEFTSAGAAGKGGGKAAASKGGKAAATQKTAAKTSPPAPQHHGSKEQLLARAHADREKARTLETELHGLVKQEQAHAAAAAKAKAQVAKLKKAGHHSIANQHHVTHHHHASRARSLKTRIAGLRKQIHGLREQADRLEAQAKGMRSGGTTVDYRAKAPYGDVPYGDPGYLDADGNQASKSGNPGVKRYPLTADKVQAAWSYINQAKNAGQYTPGQLSAIKGRIKAAMTTHGHQVSNDSSGGRSAPAWGDTERRYTPGVVEYRAAEDGRHIGGYAIVFDKLSRNLGGFVERAAPGVVNQSRQLGWPNVVARFNHDSNMILGTSAARTLTLQPDNIGLDYDVDPPQARNDIVELVQRGDIRYSSFAFRVPDGGDEWGVTDQNYPMRTLLEVQLVDVAPVLDPAYPDATAGLRSLATAMNAPFEDVTDLAAHDELRRFFVRTDRPSFTPPKPKITGAAAMMQLMEKKFPELSQ